MADAIKKAKINRKSKLGAFTRKKNRLQTLLDGGTGEETLKTVYNELADDFKLVETAHDELCLLLEEDDEDASSSYLDDPADALSQMQLKVDKAVSESGQRIKENTEKEERKRQFDSSLALFKTNVQNFGKPSSNLLQLKEAKSISFGDMRLELQKIEASLTKLQTDKEKSLELDPTASFMEYTSSLTVLLSMR